MSGHSKWAQIKRAKGAADVKRGLVFTKLSNVISIAVKQSGGITNPEQNFKLRLAIDAAKAANMPKDTIERAILRATSKQGEDFSEALYEGFAPGGVAVLITTATDNKNRTLGQVQMTLSKNGGAIGQSGSVSYLFKQVGEIIIEKGTKDVDEILLIVADCGAEDIEERGEEIAVFTQTTQLTQVKDAMQKQGFVIKEANLIWQPLTKMYITDPEMQEKIMALIEKLEELDDVQSVYTNFEIA